MEITIDNRTYEDLRIIRNNDAERLIRIFGNLNKVGYDGVLGAHFKYRFIGYQGFMPKRNWLNLKYSMEHSKREVYMCEYQGKYWISLNYGFNNHIDFPLRLKRNHNEIRPNNKKSR